MNHPRPLYLAFFLLGFLMLMPAAGQTAKPKYIPPETRILFIFDASQSMAGKWEKESKISIAQKVLIHIIDSLENLENVQMA
ncbi:MAG: hypothetical protein H6Q21_1097, partial [Bacteroidetes bacterium]|nr:hypothetical protein [Bacteroidota bacterium]